MRWYLNPLLLTRAARATRRLLAGGRPNAVRVTGADRPEGVIFPTSSVSVEVEARDGTVTRLTPELPVPWPYAWGYRLARRLELPLVSAFDSQRVSFELRLPQSVLGR
jgi:hypothetical protein